MKHLPNETRKLWVYDKYSQALSEMSVVFRVAAHETWYETEARHTFDPYYVDESKADLVERVHSILNRQLQEKLDSAEELMNAMRRLIKDTK